MTETVRQDFFDTEHVSLFRPVRFPLGPLRLTLPVRTVWGKSIEAPCMPWEDYLATQAPASSRLPSRFKTFDFFNDVTGLVISAKTLDATTSVKISNSVQMSSSLKGNTDAVARFTTARSGETAINSEGIFMKQLSVAVPVGTTSAQWLQIEEAVKYGASQGVKIVITVVK